MSILPDLVFGRDSRHGAFDSHFLALERGILLPNPVAVDIVIDPRGHGVPDRRADGTPFDHWAIRLGRPVIGDD